MLPTRQAIIIALIMLLVGLTLSIERVGTHYAPWLDNAGKTLASYNLEGWAATCWLASAHQYEKAAELSLRNNREASLSASDAAASAYAHAALVFVKHNQLTQAVAAFSAALRCAPSRNDLKVQLLTLQHQQGDPQALRTLTDLSYRYDVPQAQLILADIALSTRREAEAISLLRHAATRAPQDFEIQSGITRLFSRIGDTQAAQQAARAAWASAVGKQQLEAYRLLKQTGTMAPWWGVFWGTYLAQQYGGAFIGLLLYLVIIFSPYLCIMFNIRQPATMLPNTSH